MTIENPTYTASVNGKDDELAEVVTIKPISYQTKTYLQDKYFNEEEFVNQKQKQLNALQTEIDKINANIDTLMTQAEAIMVSDIKPPEMLDDGIEYLKACIKTCAENENKSKNIKTILDNIYILKLSLSTIVKEKEILQDLLWKRNTYLKDNINVDAYRAYYRHDTEQPELFEPTVVGETKPKIKPILVHHGPKGFVKSGAEDSIVKLNIFQELDYHFIQNIYFHIKDDLKFNKRYFPNSDNDKIKDLICLKKKYRKLYYKSIWNKIAKFIGINLTFKNKNIS